MRVVWNLTLEQDSVGQIIYVTRRFFRKQSPALCDVEILCCKVKGRIKSIRKVGNNGYTR